MRALIVGLFAFVLVIQAAAAATKAETTDTAQRTAVVAKKEQKQLTLEQRLERARTNARKYRGKVRFYETHRELLATGETRSQASSKLRDAKRHYVKAKRAVARLERALERRDARRLASMPPRAAICDVFGNSYCRQAVNVAWCESRLNVSAQNGQYLGLFQMGSYARRLFGHGSTAHEQAVAAHRYFVRSGRDWSPWSCRWAAF